MKRPFARGTTQVRGRNRSPWLPALPTNGMILQLSPDCFLNLFAWSKHPFRATHISLEFMPPHPASHCLHVAQHHSPFPRSQIWHKIRPNHHDSRKYSPKNCLKMMSSSKNNWFSIKNDPQQRTVSKEIWELPNFANTPCRVARSMPSSPHSHASSMQ